MSKSFEWKSDEWYVDKYGHMRLKEAYDDEVDMVTLVPIYSEEKEDYLMQQVKI